MSTIPYIVNHYIDAAELIKCGYGGRLNIAGVYDIELNDVVVLWGSAFEGGHP